MQTCKIDFTDTEEMADGEDLQPLVFDNGSDVVKVSVVSCLKS